MILHRPVVAARFIAALAPAITFGSRFLDGTNGQFGVMEMIMSTCISGLIFSTFSGQPLSILGATGPFLAYTLVVYDLAVAVDVEFTPGAEPWDSAIGITGTRAGGHCAASTTEAAWTNDAWFVCSAPSLAPDSIDSGASAVLAARRNRLMHALVGNGGPAATGADPWLVQDPWQQAPKSGKPKPAKITSSKWEDMQIPHMDELEPLLSQISLQELQPEATGIVLTNMATVDRYKWVRSQLPLCMVVPGHDRDDLKQLLAGGIGESAACAGELTLRDPTKERRERRRVTLINLGASPVTFTALPTDLKVPVSDTVELWFSVHKRYAGNLWQQVFQGNRKAMAKTVTALRNDKDPTSEIPGALIEVYGYTHNQASCECAARVPSSAAEKLLRQSGTHGVFVRRLKRAGQTAGNEEVILWVNTSTVAELQARIQPLRGVQGLAVNKQGLGVRVTGTGDELAQARAVLQPGKVHQSTAKIRGNLHFEVSGLPLQTEADDVQALLASGVQAQAWTPWQVRPLRSFVRKDQRTWVVAADAAPAKDKLLTSTGSVIIEKLATPQEMHQKRHDQKQAAKAERRRYDPARISESAVVPPAQSQSATPQGPSAHSNEVSELRRYVDAKFSALKGDLDSQAKKLHGISDDMNGLQAFVKDTMKKVATKDDISQLLHEALADKRQKTAPAPSA